MAFVTIEAASKLTRKHRSTISRHIKEGKLSRTDRGIDTAELIRVYGEFDAPREIKTSEVMSQRETLLQRQIELLQNEIDAARKREEWLQGLIDTRLPAPGRFKFWK